MIRLVNLSVVGWVKINVDIACKLKKNSLDNH